MSANEMRINDDRHDNNNNNFLYAIGLSRKTNDVTTRVHRSRHRSDRAYSISRTYRYNQGADLNANCIFSPECPKIKLSKQKVRFIHQRNKK